MGGGVDYWTQNIWNLSFYTEYTHIIIQSYTIQLPYVEVNLSGLPNEV